MNTHFTLVAIALAVAASVNGDFCNKDQTQAAIASMSGLLRMPEVTLCGKSSGFNLVSSKTAPNPSQEEAMCKASACHTLIALLQSASPPDCELKIRASGAVLNIKTMVDGFESKCKSPNSTRFNDPPIDPTNMRTGRALPVSMVSSKRVQLSAYKAERSTPKPLPVTIGPKLAPPTTFYPSRDRRNDELRYKTAAIDYETTEKDYETVEEEYDTVEEDREFADPISAPVSAPKPNN